MQYLQLKGVNSSIQLIKSMRSLSKLGTLFHDLKSVNVVEILIRNYDCKIYLLSHFRKDLGF